MENKKQAKSQYPEVIVGGLIRNQDGLILLARIKKHKGQYSIFGGHVKLGETLEAALKREVKEEAGIEVSIEKPIRFAESIFDPDLTSNKHYIFCDFLCSFGGDKDEVTPNQDEFEDDYIWVDPEGALKMDISPSVEKLIKVYLEEKKKEDYLAGWQRCLADFENYKKRQLESQRSLGEHVKEDLVLQILPVIDNFEASLAHVPTDKKDDSWVTGIMYIQKQLENILKENKVEIIETKVDDEFNPEIHEAIQKGEEKSKTNKIGEVIQKGYKMGDKIIRAVKVTIK